MLEFGCGESFPKNWIQFWFDFRNNYNFRIDGRVAIRDSFETGRIRRDINDRRS